MTDPSQPVYYRFPRTQALYTPPLEHLSPIRSWGTELLRAAVVLALVVAFFMAYQ